MNILTQAEKLQNARLRLQILEETLASSTQQEQHAKNSVPNYSNPDYIFYKSLHNMFENNIYGLNSRINTVKAEIKQLELPPPPPPLQRINRVPSLQVIHKY